MNKTKMNILVINEGYSNNLGDQAINKSFAHIIKNIYKNNYFFEDLNRKKIDNDYKNLNINFKKPSLIISWIYRFYWFLLNFKRINRSLIKIDYVLIGGGQLLMPNNIFPYVIFIWTLLIRLKKIPYSFFSVGSQGNYDLIDRFFLNKSLQKAENIYVRDNLTQSILKKTFNVNSLLTYDVAFFFNKIVKNYY